jgi:hypothetical protein
MVLLFLLPGCCDADAAGAGGVMIDDDDDDDANDDKINATTSSVHDVGFNKRCLMTSSSRCRFLAALCSTSFGGGTMVLLQTPILCLMMMIDTFLSRVTVS